MTRKDRWDEKLAAMKANRDELRTPRDWSIEEKLVIEMEALFSEMTVHEREEIERPEPPFRLSLIAHNQKGQLIGYEDFDEEYYDHGGGRGD